MIFQKCLGFLQLFATVPGSAASRSFISRKAAIARDIGCEFAQCEFCISFILCQANSVTLEKSKAWEKTTRPRCGVSGFVAAISCDFDASHKNKLGAVVSKAKGRA